MTDRICARCEHPVRQYIYGGMPIWLHAEVGLVKEAYFCGIDGCDCVFPGVGE